MPADKAGPLEIVRNIQINLTAPAVLLSGFIRHTQNWKMRKLVLNISSGAAVRPYFGWSAYCASKAGLEHFSRCAALEQKSRENPVTILSINPGVIDTSMQEKIRKTPVVTEPMTPLDDDVQVQRLAQKIDERARKIFGGSLHIREVDAASCNGCEVEIVGLNSPIYDAERFGIHFVASPRHADMLLVTGPVSRNMELALRKTWDATPEPKVNTSRVPSEGMNDSRLAAASDTAERISAWSRSFDMRRANTVLH